MHKFSPSLSRMSRNWHPFQTLSYDHLHASLPPFKQLPKHSGYKYWWAQRMLAFCDFFPLQDLGQVFKNSFMSTEECSRHHKYPKGLDCIVHTPNPRTMRGLLTLLLIGNCPSAWQKRAGLAIVLLWAEGRTEVLRQEQGNCLFEAFLTLLFSIQSVQPVQPQHWN